MLFEVFDWDSDGDHELIGHFTARLSQIITTGGSDGKGAEHHRAKLLHPKGGNVGTLV